MRGRKNLLRGSLAGLLVLLGILVAIPVNVVGSYLPGTVTGHRVLWIGLLIGAALVMVLLTWLSGWLGQRVAPMRFASVPVVSGWVDREQVREVVKLLTASDTRTVGITAMTGLAGAGGFGKTTLAAMVRAGLLWEVVSRRGARAQVEAVQGAGGWLLETGLFRPFWHGTWHGQRPSAHVRACRPERVCGAHSAAVRPISLLHR